MKLKWLLVLIAIVAVGYVYEFQTQRTAPVFADASRINLASHWVPIEMELETCDSTHWTYISRDRLDWTHNPIWRSAAEAPPELVPLPGHEDQAATFLDPAGHKVVLIFLPYAKLPAEQIVPTFNAKPLLEEGSVAVTLPAEYEKAWDWFKVHGPSIGLTWDLGEPPRWIFLEGGGVLEPKVPEPFHDLHCLQETKHYRVRLAAKSNLPVDPDTIPGDMEWPIQRFTLYIGDTRPVSQ